MPAEGVVAVRDVGGDLRCRACWRARRGGIVLALEATDHDSTL